jgi:hypothetical protein
MTKGFPRFAQLIRTVDHGDQLSGFKTFVQVWQVLVLLQHDQADGFACGLPNAPSENYKLEQSGQVARRYGHIGQAAQRQAVNALRAAGIEADGAQNWAQSQKARMKQLAN